MRAGRLVPNVPLPHEPEAWMTFRTLSARQLDEAEQVATDKQMELSNKLKPETIAAIQAAQTGRRDRNLEDSYDKDTVVKYGLAGCSECDPCTDESKQNLDSQTRDWAFTEIIRMNVRPLASGSGSENTSSQENSHENLASLTASSSLE